MRTSLSALVLAAAFAATVGGANAQSIFGPAEYAGGTVLEFTTKTSSVPAQTSNQRIVPVFSAEQNRGIHVNPTHSDMSGK